jgi:hypothetical protein
MIVWTTDWCGSCKTLKQWIQDNNLQDAVEIKLTDEGAPMTVSSVPTLELEDGKLIVGIEPIKRKLQTLLDGE